jgi:hypothetical protein
MAKFGYDDHNSSLNTNTLKLSNVYTNWGYLFLNADEECRALMQELVDEEHGGFVLVKPQDFALHMLDLFFNLSPEIQPLFDGYDAMQIAGMEQVYRTNPKSMVMRLADDLRENEFNGSGQRFAANIYPMTPEGFSQWPSDWAFPIYVDDNMPGENAVHIINEVMESSDPEEYEEYYCYGGDFFYKRKDSPKYWMDEDDEADVSFDTIEEMKQYINNGGWEGTHAPEPTPEVEEVASDVDELPEGENESIWSEKRKAFIKIARNGEPGVWDDDLNVFVLTEESKNDTEPVTAGIVDKASEAQPEINWSDTKTGISEKEEYSALVKKLAFAQHKLAKTKNSYRKPTLGAPRKAPVKMEQWKKDALKRLEGEVSKALKAIDRFKFNHAGLRQVMRQLNIPAASWNGSGMVKEWGNWTQGYKINDGGWSPEKVDLYQIGKEKFLNLIKTLEAKGFEIDVVSEPSKAINGDSVAYFTIEQYHTDEDLKGNTKLNEDAPVSPWALAVGPAVVLSVVVASVIREYKKGKAKAEAGGVKMDGATRKKVLVNALQKAILEVQKAHNS